MYDLASSCIDPLENVCSMNYTDLSNIYIFYFYVKMIK